MKLRNKKTGEAVYVDFRMPLSNNDETLGPYSVTSLEALNRSFEDYKPKEPLIKDEKIRKAILAWAELIPSAQVRYDHSYGRFYTHSDYIQPYSISFPVILGLDETKDYTIAELCGEEEE